MRFGTVRVYGMKSREVVAVGLVSAVMRTGGRVGRMIEARHEGVSAGMYGSATRRAGRMFGGVLATALLGAALAVGGCLARERICRSEEYPVKAVGNKTGRTCVPDGREPPAGYVRYPDGKVPKYVDDEWDKYWRTVVVDDNGNVVAG
jgi:hypothetical protein